MNVIIIGGGPAGLFAAYELGKHGVKSIVVEKGFDVKKRMREMKKSDNHYMCGIGGCGLFSDGKLNFHPEIGGNMLEFLSKNETEEMMNYVEGVFSSLGVEEEARIHEKCEELIKRAMVSGVRYIPIRQKHIGSDQLPKVIGNLMNELRHFGVEIKTKREAVDITVKGNKIDGVVVKKNGKKEKMNADYVICAPGRGGAQWFSSIAKKYSIQFKYLPLDIGVRVEVPNKIMEEITSVSWDPKFHIRTKHHDDLVRTFCTNPSGYVITEDYGRFIAVNGHSRKDRKTNNTNFAFIVRIVLTEPLENTTQYGESICRLATTIGGGKPIIQRFGDLQVGRRSTWERIEKSYVEPTNRNVTPGDLSMAMPGRIVEDIVDGLKILNNVIPGIAESSTLLYAPEVKFKCIRLDIHRTMEVKKIKNFFTCGDGAGVSGGIISAAITGIIAAREIIKRIKNEDINGQC